MALSLEAVTDACLVREKARGCVGAVVVVVVVDVSTRVSCVRSWSVAKCGCTGVAGVVTAGTVATGSWGSAHPHFVSLR